MKKTLALGLLVLLFLPAGACDNMQKKLTADYDQRFIDTIIAHYQSGIEAAGLAQSKAQNAELKSFAGKMAADLQDEAGMMKQLRGQLYKEKEKAVDGELTGMKTPLDIEQLNFATGADFDSTFLDLMMQHCRESFELAKEAREKAELADIKQLARRVVDSQQKNIDMMSKWKPAPGGTAQ